MSDEPSAEDRAVARRVRRELQHDADDPVPKLPRGKGFRVPKGHVYKIALTAMLLVMIVVLRKPCADSVSGFVTSFDKGSGSSTLPKPGTVEPGSGSQHFEPIGGDMTEAERNAAIEREFARARAAAAGSGSAAAICPGGAGSGSACTQGSATMPGPGSSR